MSQKMFQPVWELKTSSTGVLKDGILEDGAEGRECHADLVVLFSSSLPHFQHFSFVSSQNGLCDGWFFLAFHCCSLCPGRVGSILCQMALQPNSQNPYFKAITDQKKGLVAKLINTSRHQATGPENCSHGTQAHQGKSPDMPLH